MADRHMVTRSYVERETAQIIS